jgi:hypothetical protein
VTGLRHAGLFHLVGFDSTLRFNGTSAIVEQDRRASS